MKTVALHVCCTGEPMEVERVAEKSQFHMRWGVSVLTPPPSQGLRLDIDMLLRLSLPCFLPCNADIKYIRGLKFTLNEMVYIKHLNTWELLLILSVFSVAFYFFNDCKLNQFLS